ncbi:hypothetical protein [Sandaracinus amylolyticus]|uniref:hypothetical protein n=1 Tax=Sandaracinus amylolyticus TaxID=927083 RepID=UPI001F15C912|nr:hypothetical protein [Sandaracinus amylolyticus]UJR86797.1 Hypothetical protein I5071_88980 [Sandaracinus amylolyticus]
MRTKAGLSIALLVALFVLADVARADAVPACGPFEHREGRPHESECRFGPAWLCSASASSRDGASAIPLVALAGIVVMARRRSRR